MKKTNYKPTGIDIDFFGEDISVVVGDTDFQETLTDREWRYIHEGCNWISKFGRETTIKGLHNIGYTLDDVEAFPDDERQRIFKEANDAWNSLYMQK